MLLIVADQLEMNKENGNAFNNISVITDYQ